MLRLKIFLATSLVALSLAFSGYESLFQNEEVKSLLYHQNDLLVSTIKGVFKVQPSKKQVLYDKLQNDVVTCLAEHQSKVYAGTFNGKILVLNGEGLEKSLTLPKVGENEKFCVVDLLVDEDQIWLATLEGVVFQYKPETDAILHYNLQSYNRKALLSIDGLAKDGKGNLWVNAQDKIYFLTTIFSGKKNSDQYEFLGSSAYESEPMFMGQTTNNSVYVFASKDGENELSIGKFRSQLMDAQKKSIDLPGELRMASPRAFYLQDQETLWVLGQELFKYKDDEWTSYAVDGLGSEINAMTVNDNQVWIASNQGLRSIEVND